MAIRGRAAGPGPGDAAPRVGLFGRLGSGNIGNDATMEAVLAYLKANQPGAVLDCMCSGPDQVTSRFGIPATQLHWLHADRRARSRRVHAGLTVLRIGAGAVVDAWRTAAWVRRHDVVIVPGMGVLEATLPQRPWQLPYSLLLLSSFGRLFGTRVALVSIGATVIRQRMTGRLLATAARLAYYRSFRDQYSLDAARRMRAAGDADRVYPDLVFSLPTLPAAPGPARTVGVGVMAYFGAPDERPRAEEIHDEYVDKLQRFVRWLVETGHPVRLLIGDAADEPVARAILSHAETYRLPGAAPVVYEHFASVDELIGQVAALDAVVATRFHSVLVALTCAKPTVAIGYGRKHDALMTHMGVGQYAQDIRTLDIDRLKEQLTALEVNRADVTRTLVERNRANRTRLEAQFAELNAVLFAPAPRVGSSAR